MATISTHNGNSVSAKHNQRDTKITRKERHIDPNGIHETWIDINHRKAYNDLFSDSVNEYNKGKKPSRQIKDYYAKVSGEYKQNPKRNPAPVREMIIGIYQEPGVTDDVKKDIMKRFVDGWDERNPSMKLVGAYYHADEDGEPHVHIDYIPVAKGKGMALKNSMSGALSDMGHQDNGVRSHALEEWIHSENACLEQYCCDRGISVFHPDKGNAKKHLEIAEYKAQKLMHDMDEYKNSLTNEVNCLIERKKDLEMNISSLEDEISLKSALTRSKADYEAKAKACDEKKAEYEAAEAAAIAERDKFKSYNKTMDRVKETNSQLAEKEKSDLDQQLKQFKNIGDWM